MKKSLLAIVIICGSIFVAGAVAHTDDGHDITRTFEAKAKMEIKTISGNCIIKAGAGDKINVEMTSSYRPSSSFRPVIEERGDRLIIEEKMRGSNSGESTWRLTVPEKTEIEFSSASGGFDARGLRGKIEVSTASGEITVVDFKGELTIDAASGDISIADVSGEISAEDASGSISGKNLSGDIELQNASGDVEVEQISGRLRLSSASGNVDALAVSIDGRSEFSSASGSARVGLAKTPEYDMDVSSASGKAVLSFKGNKVKGHIEMTAQEDHGKIMAPFNFEHEESFSDGNQDYVRKSFTQGAEAPEITIETGSGSAILEE